MKLQPTIAIATLMVSVSFGTSGAIAAESQPALAQKPGVCHQISPEYSDVYTFETENHSIIICQKGKQYYYIQMPKLANSTR